MTLLKLIIQSFKHYGKQNLTIALGVAISTAVLTGALIIGDSVQYSLLKIVQFRLGNTTHILSAGDRYFSDSLAFRMKNKIGGELSPLLILDGVASAKGGRFKIPKVQVVGIKTDFKEVITSNENLNFTDKNAAFISHNLSKRMNLKEGDEFSLRIKKVSAIPANAPFVSDAENIISISLKVAGIIEDKEGGQFHLSNIQTAPFNVFLDFAFLNESMEIRDLANHLLIVKNGNSGTDEIEEALSQSWSLEDINLHIRENILQKAFEITSSRVFIDKSIQDNLKESPVQKEFILTYFVNRISNGEKITPYSFVSTLPSGDLQAHEIIINEWLAQDLNVSVADSVRLDYFTIGPLRELEEHTSQFVIKKIVPIDGKWADESLMPNLPGLSDAGNCRDWETGVPIDLEAIRDNDEDYWKKYKGIPKAYISYEKAHSLWQNRFGESTIIRFPSTNSSREDIEKIVKNHFDPSQLGFAVKAVKDEAEIAAKGGVDFSGLFLGLSFFLLVAGILLTVLLFQLNTENRMGQVGTLSILGYSKIQIKKLFLLEGLLVAVSGAFFGLLLATLYNKLIFYALNSIWTSIVRTQNLSVHIEGSTLIIGFFISVLLSIIAIYFSLNSLFKQQVHSLQSKIISAPKKWQTILIKTMAYGLGMFAIIAIGFQFLMGEQINPGIFFAAGGMLLISFLLFARSYLQRTPTHRQVELTAQKLSVQNISRNPARSFLVIALFAIGTFLVVSTGANRKDLFSNAHENSSGTGGFLFFAESSVPVLYNLNNPEVRFNFGLEEDCHFVQFRKHDGDDASCLNLNRISTPGILGVRSKELSGRFQFITKTDELDSEAPWYSLSQPFDENTIPAFADQTVIQWGLGMKVGDTLQYINELGDVLNVELVGGLANSIFQGSILIDDSQFLKHFPSSSGSKVFLVDGGPEKETAIQNELNRAFRDYGWSMQAAADRLAEFNSVENTYLSIFLILGGLGLIIGTIGLGIVLARNLLTRRSELGILRSIGIGKNLILRIYVLEHFYLLLAGVGIGLISALLATLPNWLNPHQTTSIWMIAFIVLLIFLNGLLWIYVITSKALKEKKINHLISG